MAPKLYIQDTLGYHSKFIGAPWDIHFWRKYITAWHPSDTTWATNKTVLNYSVKDYTSLWYNNCIFAKLDVGQLLWKNQAQYKNKYRTGNEESNIKTDSSSELCSAQKGHPSQ